MVSALDIELGAGRHRAKLYYLCNFQPEDRLLDLGCGYGQMIYWAAQICKSAVGIDLVQGRKDVFMKYGHPSFREKIDYRIMNFDNYEPNEKFTIITMFDVIEHITEKQFDMLIPKIIDSLESKGRFICYTPSLTAKLTPYNKVKPWTLEQYKEDFEKPSGHITHYSLWGLMTKLTEAGLVVTAGFIGSKGRYNLMDDIRATQIKELGLTVIARKI